MNGRNVPHCIAYRFYVGKFNMSQQEKPMCKWLMMAEFHLAPATSVLGS